MAYIGRAQIFTSYIPDDNNITQIISDALVIHEQNRLEIDYLYNVYRGDQDILDRVKEIRPEINNKIVENHAYEFTEFKKGYTFGEPVQYIQNGKVEDKPPLQKKDDRVAILNTLMNLDDKASKDTDLSEWFYVCGTGYRMTLPKQDAEMGDSPFETEISDPRDTFIIYSNQFGQKPILCCKCINIEDTAVSIKKQYAVYSKNRYWLIQDNEVIITDVNPLGLLPIIEYPANKARLGCFEVVLPILDAMNTVASNRTDGVEQFVQALMKFTNCDIDETTFESLLQLGAIKIKSTDPSAPADVQIMTAELDQMQTQTLIDYMYQTALVIAGVPDRKASAGGNTGQALIIGQGWTNAESRALAMEQIFKKSERAFLKIVLRILRDSSQTPTGLLDLKLSDIGIQFTRNRTDSLLVKTQGLLNLLQAGIHPRISIATCGLFSDPEKVYSESTEYMEKWKTLTQTVANNNPQEAGVN